MTTRVLNSIKASRSLSHGNFLGGIEWGLPYWIPVEKEQGQGDSLNLGPNSPLFARERTGEAWGRVTPETLVIRPFAHTENLKTYSHRRRTGNWFVPN